ncbi:MAG: 2-amino-4-hydroxy-6-hydroxymethyldihydropteridine diphosphokinase [Bacteroidales bacterium]|nr:2-amino-4-hydroxy-6-hydroxymethyldihydropteridine diphosphokinase [Bacteroidales bacterium]MCD8395039.1 2-amino-4-hydroxy-6-hydroxymethyldihydropteridine diphosphokinase [Bacteroidales bacterium]
MTTYRVRIGSNAPDRLARVEEAIRRLPGVAWRGPIVESRDWRCPDDPHAMIYANAEVACQSPLPNDQFIALLKRIETEMGRDRSHPTLVLIDLDLL